jgi:hypothetical protein
LSTIWLNIRCTDRCIRVSVAGYGPRDATGETVSERPADARTRRQQPPVSHRVRQHADATIEALPLDAAGRVPWWPPGEDEVTLRRVLLHVATETNRHAGHADILRELLDGDVGLRDTARNMPDGDAAWWAAYRERLEHAARQSGGLET